MASEPRKSSQPRPEEQIRPEALVRVIKKEKPLKWERLKGSGKKWPRGIVWGILGLIVLFVVGSVVSFYIAKANLKRSIASQAATLKAGVADLQNFDTQSAAQQFSLLTASGSTPTLENFIGAFGSIFSGGRDTVASFSDLAGQLANLSQEANSLGGSVFDFASANTSTSPNLVSELTNVRNTLGSIDADSNTLSSALSSFGGSSQAVGGGNFYLPLKAQVEGAENFLDEFIPWLATSTPHHVLVLFNNTSEMRPGGGFLGSYADVTIASGTITNITVHDIADVDTGFAPKIIPPPPLQLEVTNFRPADTNWFLDFPTSASETLQFFEESKLYGGTAVASSTAFDGVIAITPKVVSDLLSVTGPITIAASPKGASTTFTSDNLLIQIQNIVQQGQSQLSSATYPKAVLSQLSSAIFQNLASSTDAQKQELLAMAFDWVNKKDVMAYFKDPVFENFLEGYGATGDLYQLPQNFNGDYLSLADANIRGDKSDLYVAQNVALDSQIGADGTITDDLSITRTHNGNQSPYWWYQTTSQDYLQVFVPDGSSLTDETGGVTKAISAPINYARSGYSTDPLIAAIASTTQSLLLYPAVTTHEEDGKEVFATWSRVAAGKSTTLEFDYTHRGYLPPAEGVAYQFVFDKQPGSVRSYDFTIDAPLGYVFAENGLASYEYTSDDPPGRLVINLTLQKI